MTINIKQYFLFIFGNQEGLSPKTKGNYKDTKHGETNPGTISKKHKV
jgi:hypothetical protein